MDSAGPSTSKISDFESTNSDLQAAALKATKLAAGLPVDLQFHRSLDKQFAQALDACSDSVLNLTNRLLTFVSSVEQSSSKGKGKQRLEDEDDVVDKFNSIVVDVVDQLFEKADRGLDEHLGRLKPAAIQVKPQERKLERVNARKAKSDAVITHASYLPKPQLKFAHKVDNSREYVWRPTLAHKYNAQVPLGYNLRPNDRDIEFEAELQTFHPYRYEISNISYPSHIFEHMDPAPIRSFEDTPFTWIDTKDGLTNLLDKLRGVREIAIDLEHHSYRTFTGFLCLMQISTRMEDFIVDTLALRDELEELNEVFTNPRIVKIFHGAESDIVWLQQDFNLYIVNLFDTYHASKVLDFPKHSLAALLEMYCDFVPDKRYQLADWRIRPLPKEMLDYARSDTHYLLYIYDSLRNALLDRAQGQPDLLREVLNRSQETALRTYQTEPYDFESGLGPNGWDTLAQKWNKSFTGLNLAVYKCVHAWRDRVAREEDESLRYVLPNHCIFKLAEQPPAGMASLLGAFHPIPQLVRARSAELLQTIRATVTECLSTVGAGSAPADVEMTAESVSRTNVDAPQQQSVNVTPESDAGQSLWHDHDDRRASSSAFVGKSFNKEKLTTAWKSPASTLFPSAPPIRLHSSRSAAQEWKEVALQIHHDLSINPTISAIPAIDVNEDEVAVVVQEMQEATVTASASAPAQAEVPFIPSTQRQKQVVEVEDTIVVVGQARQRKRKRVKDPNSSAENESTSSASLGSPRPDSKKAKRKEDTAVAEEPFDYSSVPNILDNIPQPPTGSLSKKERLKKKDLQNGSFPRAPKSLSEQKGGNLTHTFR